MTLAVSVCEYVLVVLVRSLDDGLPVKRTKYVLSLVPFDANGVSDVFKAGQLCSSLIKLEYFSSTLFVYV